MAHSNTCKNFRALSLSEKLYNAVKEENYKIMQECLLNAKSSLFSYSDLDGNTALHVASINGSVKIVKMLVRHGANLNACSKINKIPLHFASENGHTEIVDFLIICGSKLNTQDSLKMTPLHWAVEKNHTEIVQIICNNREADINIRDKYERTCLSIALENKNDKIVKIIENTIKEREENDFNYFNQLETRFEKSSLKINRSANFLTESLNLNAEEENRLKEFYRKKSFSKALSSKFNRSFEVFKNNGTDYQNILPSTSFSTSESNNFNQFRVNEIPNDQVYKDIDSDDSVSQNDSSKKTRLSYSPVSNIDDTLFWLKNQSESLNKKLLENCEISLTEAGVKTLEYLNRSDPIKDEQRLFMRIFKSMEENEKFDKEKNQLNDQSDISLSSSQNSESNLELINTLKQYEVDKNLCFKKS